jgi:N-acetylmuramoyl-L-alanine amidase
VTVSGGKRYYQYEPVLNGTIHKPASQTAKDAVADALAGWDPSGGATGFFAPAKVAKGSWVWTRTPTVTIGNHRFFK